MQWRKKNKNEKKRIEKRSQEISESKLTVELLKIINQYSLIKRVEVYESYILITPLDPETLKEWSRVSVTYEQLRFSRIQNDTDLFALGACIHRSLGANYYCVNHNGRKADPEVGQQDEPAYVNITIKNYDELYKKAYRAPF